jgi:hypothetical protein
MKRDRRRAIKAAEKLRKICAKEVERLGALREKYDDLRHAGPDAPLVGQLVDRLQQKELMANGDLVWAEQMIEQLRDDRPAAPAPVTPGEPQRPALKLI